ncbi:MAG: APC family permease [Candidatus Eremiobacteraeota bacterium]|nr:APC family permease [Candidatus Eremiobacteraeota bacterium]
MTTAPRALPRVLGLFDITVLAGAAMGPAYSLATTLGPMVAAAGSLAPAAFVALTAIMLCVASAFARLSATRPNAGSSYAWIAQSFGPRAGAYGAWLLVLSNYFATMTTAIPAGVYTLALFAPSLADSAPATAIVGAAWILASAVLLAFGLRPTALVTAAFFAVEVAVLGASAVAAVVLPHAPERLAASHAVVPAAAAGGFVSAMVLAIWMSDGWEVSASASEETTGPGATAGRGGIVGLLITSAILLVAMLAYQRVGSVAGFSAHQTDAMAYVADRLGGGWWRIAIVFTVLVSTAATLWTTMLYLSRSVFAMGRDGVLPSALGTLDKRAVPLGALLTVTVLVTAFTLLTGFSPSVKDALGLVLNGTSAFLGLLFAGSAAAALREPGRRLDPAMLVPAFGAVALLGIVAVSIARADAATQRIELAGLALGVPFALWRGGRTRPFSKVLEGGGDEHPALT